MSTALTDVHLSWVSKFTGIDVTKATEPVDHQDGRMFSSPVAKADSGAPPAVTEEYIRGYLFHYDFLPAKDGSDASAGNCIFSNGTATISDVIKWLEKQATADGYSLDANLELQTANTVYQERQHAQQMGFKTAEKFDAGGDVRFLLTGIAKSKMQDMLDALEAMRAKQQLDAVKAVVLTGPSSDINTPKMRAAILTVQRDLGDDWKKEMAQLNDDDAKTIRQHVLAEMDEGDFVPPAASSSSAPRPGAKKDDDPDYTIEADPTQGKADTQVQYTIKLKATNDDDPPKVQLLPDVEVTLHVGAAGAVSIENQLNLVKADIGRLLKIGGTIKIEAKVGLSGEADIQDAAIGKIAKSLEVKIKAEVEVTITKHISVKVGIEEGPDGKPQGGPGVVWHF